MRTLRVMVGLFGAGLVAAPVVGQTGAGAEQDPQEAIHNELRALRDSLIAAVNAADIDRVLTYVHPDVVLVAQNAEVARRREGVRAYFEKMVTGPDHIVESFTTHPTVAELTILHGQDAGVAYGGSQDHYVLNNGMDFEVASRWSASVVREDGRWLIASFHASANLFDNPVLSLAKRAGYMVGGLALAIGLAVGIGGTAWYGRRRRHAG